MYTVFMENIGGERGRDDTVTFENLDLEEVTVFAEGITDLCDTVYVVDKTLDLFLQFEKGDDDASDN